MEPHRLPLLRLLRLLLFAVARPVGEVIAVLHDAVPGQPPGIALGALRVRIRRVDVTVVEPLLVGAASAVTSDDLPLFVAVLMVALVPVSPPQDAYSYPFPLLFVALVQRPVRLVVVSESGLRQVLELGVGRPVVPMARLLLPPYLAQPAPLGVDQVVPAALHVLPQLRPLDDAVRVVVPFVVALDVGG